MKSAGPWWWKTSVTMEIFTLTQKMHAPTPPRRRQPPQEPTAPKRVAPPAPKAAAVQEHRNTPAPKSASAGPHHAAPQNGGKNAAGGIMAIVRENKLAAPLCQKKKHRITCGAFIYPLISKIAYTLLTLYISLRATAAASGYSDYPLLSDEAGQ